MATVRVDVQARPQRGFWRCGMYWPVANTVRDVTEEQAERLLAEPNLRVKVVKPDEVPTHEPPTAKGAPPTHYQSGGEKPPARDEDAREDVVVAGAAESPKPESSQRRNKR